MRTVTTDGTEVQSPDLELGFVEQGKLLVQHHDETPYVPAQYTEELVAEYDNGGKLYKTVETSPEIPYQPAWDEYEDVYFYYPYSEEQLANIEKQKQEELQAQQEEQERLEQEAKELEAKQAEQAEQAKQERALRLMLTLVMPTLDTSALTDSKVAALSPYYEPWDEKSKSYKKGTPFYYVTSDGTTKYFRCSQDVVSTNVYKPGDPGTESLYYEIKIAADGIQVWQEVKGEYNAPDMGDLVHYPDENGEVYESLVNDNAYSPDVYPQNWKLVP